MFYRFGQYIYRGRWLIISLCLVTILACIPFLPSIIKPFKTTGFVAETSKSAQAERYLNDKLGYHNNNKLIIIYSSPKLLATNPAFKHKIQQSLSKLKHFPLKHEVFYFDNKKQISKDKHTAYVVVIIKSKESINNNLLKQFKSAIKKPKGMTIHIGGEAVFVEKVNTQLQRDMIQADFIAAPAALITLLLVFGSLTAAMLPIILGGCAAVMILSTLFFIAHIHVLSIFTLNIALLLGLCLNLDYSLFIISRFREELQKKASCQEAIAVMTATAGKAIFFSGLAIFVSLSALLIFPVNILFSAAVGGLVAVCFAVIMAAIVLPAILAVLYTRIDWLSIPFPWKKRKPMYLWRRFAGVIVSHPLCFFIPTLLFLLLLGYPFLSVKYGISDHKIFPLHSENRSFFDIYAKKFKIEELTPIMLLAKTPSQSILSRSHINQLYDLAQRIKKNKWIYEVNSIVTTKPALTKNQYYHLYKNTKKHPSSHKDIKKFLDATTAYDVTSMNIVSKFQINTKQTDHLIQDLREIKKAPKMKLALTGMPVLNQEVMLSIAHYLPYAIVWIIVLTYLILLILLRSLFLPVKAILMNLISLCACYGALVLVFQDGYLSKLLDFEPQHMLDLSLLVIIFCAIFGFSMDYEVFLLSRIKETYDQTHSNKQSIIMGIEKSSRIITSAALIVIVICLSFLTADVLMIKAFGLGIGVAIFVDAFLIRTLLVPSTMSLLKTWNWYLPKWLKKILP